MIEKFNFKKKTDNKTMGLVKTERFEALKMCCWCLLELDILKTLPYGLPQDQIPYKLLFEEFLFYFIVNFYGYITLSLFGLVHVNDTCQNFIILVFLILFKLTLFVGNDVHNDDVVYLWVSNRWTHNKLF
jgi:hypothetical protein